MILVKASWELLTFENIFAKLQVYKFNFDIISEFMLYHNWYNSTFLFAGEMVWIILTRYARYVSSCIWKSINIKYIYLEKKVFYSL